MNPVTSEEAFAVLKEMTGEVFSEIAAGTPDYVPLEHAHGRRLAADVVADRQQPPFDRAAMDGIALPEDAETVRGTRFAVVGIHAAGGDPDRWPPPRRDQCIEIMTGAALPKGYRTVVRYEDLERESGDGESGGKETVFTLSAHTCTGGENVHPKGADYPAGALLVAAGTRVTAPHLAVLASCGLASVPVKGLPRIAVLGTGDELVSPGQRPLGHQIRASNPWSIAGELSSWGFPVATTGIEGDDRKQLGERLAALMDGHDIVLISGAVSRGLFDSVPDLLKETGVDIRVHGVRQRPGKPLLLGMRSGPGKGKSVTVMGLPGNPVSSLVAVRRYLVPLLAEGSIRAGGLPVETTEEINFEPSLTWFPAVDVVDVVDTTKSGDTAAPGRAAGGGSLKVRLRNGNGSGDFFHIAGSDGIIEVPENRRQLPAGATVTFFPWGSW